MDAKVGQYYEDENISVKDTASFYNIYNEYKKKLRKQPYKAITGTMREFGLKFKKQETIPTDGVDLWGEILHSLENWDVKQAVKKLLGLDKDKYAEIHGAPNKKKGRS